MALFLTAFFLLACRVSAGSCVSKPCGSDYRVVYWNPIREGKELVYYYEVTGVDRSDAFTDVLLQLPTTNCRDCVSIKCYDCYWNELRKCPGTFTWVQSDSLFKSYGQSPTTGLKWVGSKTDELRFAIKANPSTTTTDNGYLLTKGNSWSKCRVIGPRCNCCPPCPSKCYKPDPNNCRCNNCTDCVGNTYEVSPCTATSNRVCQPCGNCVRNVTYETSPCTPTQNRVCRDCTQCVTNVTYETRPCNQTHNRVCTSCTQCVTNMTYEVRPCDQTNNRVCANCTQCVTNMTYEVRPCNRTSDRVCEDCTQCVTDTQYEVVPCTPTTDRVCRDCQQCVTNVTYEAAPCNRTNDRVCRDCSVCVTNVTYESAPCTASSNRVCNNCTTCVPGVSYEAQTCSDYSDRVCEDCTNCTEGFFELEPCSPTADRVCQQCSNCSANEQVRFPCNATHDTVCEPCPECANCTDPNSQLSNNGLNCTCNEGFMEDPLLAAEGIFACVPTPCCQNCQECGFNRSIPCFLHDNSMCDFSCKLDPAVCTLGTTPFETGYTVNYLGRTEDAACCGAGGGSCTCFTYQLGSAGLFPLNDFILGLTCDTLIQCDPSSPFAEPCFDSVIVTGPVNPNPGVFITGFDDRDQFTNNWGIVLTGLGIDGAEGIYTLVFLGEWDESSIPLTYSAGTINPSGTDEQRTCLVDSITGPDCVDCTTNPDAVLQRARKNLMSATLTVDENSGNGNGSMVALIVFTLLNIIALAVRF